MDENNLSAILLDRLMIPLVEMEIDGLAGLKQKYSVILEDFRIEPKSEALVVWTEGKNEYFIKRFLLAKAVAGLTKNTIDAYGKYLHAAFQFIGKDADTITAMDVQAYLASVMMRSSKVNADNVRRVLSSFFGWMLREELITKNPMNKVDAIKIQKKKKKAFSDMECELLRSNCETNRERAVVEMLLSTGCRVSELASIKTADIDEDHITVLGKGQKERIVYLNAKSQIAVKNYLMERTDSNPYLFPRRKDQKECTGDYVNKNWYQKAEYVHPALGCDKGSIEYIVRAIGKKAEVENVHPHRFRRTCATMALNRGMPIEQVSKMLGHETVATTQIYLDLQEETLASSHRKYVV